ncbi:MAG TPA: hypothetical protein VHE59_07135 [Mucilaginibacter sp.]|nr:hypothetical protein [Mucilaginibacter sp.]
MPEVFIFILFLPALALLLPDEAVCPLAANFPLLTEFLADCSLLGAEVAAKLPLDPATAVVLPAVVVLFAVACPVAAALVVLGPAALLAAAFAEVFKEEPAVTAALLVLPAADFTAETALTAVCLVIVVAWIVAFLTAAAVACLDTLARKAALVAVETATLACANVNCATNMAVANRIVFNTFFIGFVFSSTINGFSAIVDFLF